MVENTNGEVDRVDPDGDAGEGHEDAGQEEDEDEQHLDSIVVSEFVDTLTNTESETNPNNNLMSMKMNRTGLLFIVIQFLMTRAKTLERLGSEQFQRAFSFSSLWKKWRCSMNYLQYNACYHLCYPKLDQDTPHISPSPFNHLKIGSLL